MNTKKPENQGYNKAEARKIIGKAIVNLYPVEDRCLLNKAYPMEARCLLNKAYVKTMILLGKDWEDVLDASEDVLRETCAHCRMEANRELERQPAL